MTINWVWDVQSSNMWGDGTPYMPLFTNGGSLYPDGTIHTDYRLNNGALYGSVPAVSQPYNQLSILEEHAIESILKDFVHSEYSVVKGPYIHGDFEITFSSSYGISPKVFQWAKQVMPDEFEDPFIVLESPSSKVLHKIHYDSRTSILLIWYYNIDNDKWKGVEYDMSPALFINSFQMATDTYEGLQSGDMMDCTIEIYQNYTSTTN